jgi:hypothetical protein
MGQRHSARNRAALLPLVRSSRLVTSTQTTASRRKAGADRRRGRARRHLRPAHQRPRRGARSVRRRAPTSSSRRSSAPSAQGPARAAPHPPPARAARQGPRLPLHALLLPRLAPAPGLEAAAVRRRAAADPAGPGREGEPLHRRQAQDPGQAHHHAGEPCHSLATLLTELSPACETRSACRRPAPASSSSQPTPTQARALELIDAHPLDA